MTPELVERVQAARLYRDDPVNYDDHRFQWAVRVDEIQSDRIEALEAAIVQAREALERAEAAMARVVEGDGGMTTATPWRDDGNPSKNDRCPHGEWMYESCGTCADAVLDPALEAVRQALSALDRNG